MANQNQEDLFAALRGFQLTRILDQDAKNKTAILLGSFPSNEGGREQAILILEKTHFQDAFYETIGQETSCSSSSSHFAHLESLGQNDIYTWLMAWIKPQDSLDSSSSSSSTSMADMKITLIRPCTEAHIRKYTKQPKIMIIETPQIYESIVLPWMESQPRSRIAWVDNILRGEKEKENVIWRDEDEKMGFVILPDLKWDRTTQSSLYLIAIVRDPSIRSLRDLRPSQDEPQHVELLKKVRSAAIQCASSKYGLPLPQDGTSGLRCFIHYHPSYYHLHIHILSADYTSHQGAVTGQAHLLEDVIDLLEMGVNFRKRTIGYSVGKGTELGEVLEKGMKSIGPE